MVFFLKNTCPWYSLPLTDLVQIGGHCVHEQVRSHCLLLIDPPQVLCQEVVVVAVVMDVPVLEIVCQAVVVVAVLTAKYKF